MKKCIFPQKSNSAPGVSATVLVERDIEMSLLDKMKWFVGRKTNPTAFGVPLSLTSKIKVEQNFEKVPFRRSPRRGTSGHLEIPKISKICSTFRFEVRLRGITKAVGSIFSLQT